MTQFHIQKLCPILGAEVYGIDLSNSIADETFASLYEAWLDNDGLLVFKNQCLTPDQQVAFSRRFGPLFGEADQFQETVLKYLLPGQPAIFRVSNKLKDGEPQGRPKAGNYWHSDVSFRAKPAQASLLYAIELPASGGDTLFVNMYAAYSELSSGMKDMIGNLRAIHDFAVAAANSGTYTADQLLQSDFDGQNRYIHPVVITHPETKRQALYVNPGFTAAIDGFASAESESLLNMLYNHALRHEFIYRHRWKAGDLTVWDNRSLMHYAVVDYEDSRYLHRTTVIADTPSQ